MHDKRQKSKEEGLGINFFPKAKVAEVTFTLERPDAKEVYLCGDFNEWFPSSLRMIRRNGSGRWERRLMLPAGCHRYKFVVDGEWTPDPKGGKEELNPFGSVNSVVEVLL